MVRLRREIINLLALVDKNKNRNKNKNKEAL